LEKKEKIRMTISFMILEDDAVFGQRLKQIIERKLTEDLGIDVKIIITTSLSEAMEKRASADIHLVDIDLEGKGNGIDYLRELAKDYPEDEPAIPAVVISSHSEEFYKMTALNELKVIGYIEKETAYSEEDVLKDLKKAVKCVQKFDDKTVTFTRPAYKRTYKERNIWCIKRLPNGQKKIMVTVYDEFSNELIEEEFSIKSSLAEVPKLFSDPDKMIRCHQSWLVNPRIIIAQTRDDLILSSGLKIPLGGEYVENVESYIR